jgi:hypothetical protein
MLSTIIGISGYAQIITTLLDTNIRTYVHTQFERSCNFVCLPGWTTEGRSSSLHVIQTGSRDHPASYPMGTLSSFPGVRRPGREANHSPPTIAEVKKSGSIHPLPHTLFYLYLSHTSKNTKLLGGQSERAFSRAYRAVNTPCGGPPELHLAVPCAGVLTVIATGGQSV